MRAPTGRGVRRGCAGVMRAGTGVELGATGVMRAGAGVVPAARAVWACEGVMRAATGGELDAAGVTRGADGPDAEVDRGVGCGPRGDPAFEEVLRAGGRIGR
jgi:hypothetical protein